MGISGKCDFEDFVAIHSPEEVLDKYQVYANGHGLVPLKIESLKELVVYYPYLTPIICSDKETGGKVHLSEKSYIDREEEEWLTRKLDDLVRYYKKCKRNKTEFSREEALKLIKWGGETELPYETELINRVIELGGKATIEGIHDPSHDRMRDEWYQLMLDNGWSEDQVYKWVYGWQRWFDKLKINSDNYSKDGAYQQQKLRMEE